MKGTRNNTRTDKLQEQGIIPGLINESGMVNYQGWLLKETGYRTRTDK